MIRPSHTKDENQVIVYSSLLNGVANNLLGQLPSQVMDTDVIELEGMLNELYRKAYQEDWPTDLQEAVLEALCRASELSDGIQKGRQGRPRGKEFFRSIKKFVRLLQMIAIFMDEPVESRCFLQEDMLLGHR
jgi:hypothetical protein